ncbi:MAG: hypothetical protein JRI23_31795 [Deltaproteobacteria bacterium]|jgi:hypothetical protein|nr:hypothetical protein [Deltaproteobacteria bacterium]MBW2536807.1 hypothetical protein [Deltaproteobacteria bacterium]
MSGITSREQFLQVLADAERVTGGLLTQARAHRRALLEVLARHLAFARDSLGERGFPTPEQKSAVNMGSVAEQLAPAPDGTNTDPHTAWLYATLPLLDGYYRALEPPAPPRGFDWGEHVMVPWPSGQRFLGFVRLVHEQTYLVAFGNGSQQWLSAAQIQPGPAPGQPMIALTPDGQQIQGTYADRADGQYLLDLPDGTRQGFDWTHVQPQ